MKEDLELWMPTPREAHNKVTNSARREAEVPAAGGKDGVWKVLPNTLYVGALPDGTEKAALTETLSKVSSSNNLCLWTGRVT